MNEAVAELRAEGLHVPGLSDGEQEVVEQMRFIDDAHIDIEVEAALPDAYVSQQAERLKLYRELDSTKDEEALQAFESRLADRFGPLPRAAKELLNVVRLRWEAIRLGMERVKVKNGLMIVHFVGEENSPFYKSEAFMTLLQRVTQRPDRFVLKQHNNRLAMTVRNVKDVEDAYKTLEVTSQTPVPVANAYHTPETLGRDRLAAAVGATVLYPGRNVLIVDFGTAVTIDLVTADNTFRGGCISPGMKTRFRALHDYTACLPLCGPTESGELQGLTTEEAIRLGVMNSLTFEIEGYMARMEKKIDDLCVIFTGGDAKYFAKRIKNTIFANCNLVFCGLDRILEYNASEEHLD